MANKLQIKRTTVSGRTANTTSSSNSSFIDKGELAFNLADRKLYSSDTANAIFEVGSNLTNLAVSSGITVNNDGKVNFKALSGNSVYFTQQSDDNFVFYTTNTAGGARAVLNIYANTLSTAQAGALRLNTPLDLGSQGIWANSSLGGSGQYLTSNGSSAYWSSPGAASVNVNATYAWTNTHSFAANVSFNSHIGIATNNSIYLNGTSDANWRIGRNTGATTKWVYSNNSIDIIGANSTNEGVVIGLVSGNTWFETGYLGTYIAANVTIGNSSIKTTINSTAGSFDTVISTNNGNGQNYKVGDDAWIGDINTADTLAVRGQQSANNGYISFGNADTKKLGRAGTGALTYDGPFAAGNTTITGFANISSALQVSTSFYVFSNGNVGIANSVPTDPLSVTGNVYVSGSLLANMQQLSIGNTTANVVISGTQAVLSNATLVINTGTITAQTIYSTTVGATNRDLFIDDTGLLGYVSSIQAAKTNIESMTNTAWLHELRPVFFNYRKKDSQGNYTDEAEGPIEYGLIAEETEMVNPNLVFYDSVDGQLQLRGVHYNKLIVPLLNEIKTLKQRIDHLESLVLK